MHRISEELPMNPDLEKILRELSTAVAEALIDNQITEPAATKLRNLNKKLFKALQKAA